MKSFVERLFSRVIMDPVTGCWVWQGAKSGKRGYGCIKRPRSRILVKTHRASWEEYYVPIPEGLDVLHRCDNPPCCRPDHLFLGTDKDNVRDRDSKGRNVPLLGQKNGRAKLTAEQVRDIRAAKGVSQRVLARVYGIDQTTVGDILRRETWGHLPW